MNRLIIGTLTLLLVNLGFSQKSTMTIDYSVDYLVPNKTSTDTLTVGYNKEGKYLWTDYKKLAVSLASATIKDPKLIDKANINIIYDVVKGKVVMAFELDDNTMFLNIDLGLFVPNNGNNPFSDDLDIITKKRDQKIKILGKELDTYDLYPSNDSNDLLTIVTDNSYSVDNNLIINKFMELAMKISSSDGSFKAEFPPGLIMMIGEGESYLIKAIKVNDSKKTIELNYSFEIKE